MGNPYLCSNVQLINNLVEVAKRIGRSETLQASVEGDLVTLEFYRGVLLAHADGVRPPIAPNERLQLKYGLRQSMSVNALNGKHDYFKTRGPVVVSRIWYRGNAMWGFEILGGGNYRYAIEDFERFDPGEDTPTE